MGEGGGGGRGGGGAAMGNTTLNETIHGCLTSNLNSRSRIERQQIILSDSLPKNGTG